MAQRSACPARSSWPVDRCRARLCESVLVDREWLDKWRVSVTALLAELLGTFGQRFGFEPGVNAVAPPASAEAVASLAALRPAPAGELLFFYGSIGEVSLPDVGNGYFIHPPRLVAGQARAGGPRRIGPPFDVDVVAFASDGGGALYALPAGGAGPVYRLRDCAILEGVALAGTGGAEAVAGDLQEFLQHLKLAVETFTSTGGLTDLLCRQCCPVPVIMMFAGTGSRGLSIRRPSPLCADNEHYVK
jgi:hypothetical protein